MPHIAVVDLGTGNLHSVAKAIEKLAPPGQVRITSEAAVIRSADRVVLPGQGAIASWFDALIGRGLADAVQNALGTKPVLGICVGMQALFDHSDEDGGIDALGLIAGSVRRFDHQRMTELGLKVPHMGWNRVTQSADHPLWEKIADGTRFYFVHSFYASALKKEYIVGITEYGAEFVSAVARENVCAVQFHPEKSHRQGLQLLENFLAWDPDS
jgi:glutamine amidotransferase